MKKTLLTLTTIITLTATGISAYVATLPDPTEAQTNLANTANAIMITGATAIFDLIDNENKDSADS